jgi:hypothetical protein
MVELLASGQGLPERGGIAQITRDSLDGEAFEVLEIRFRTSQHAHVDAGTHERTCDGPSDESGSACDEGLHGLRGLTSDKRARCMIPQHLSA